MAEDTERWQRLSPAELADPLAGLRAAIDRIRAEPSEPEFRRQLRALAAEGAIWEQLALLLDHEARIAHRDREVAAALYEELADAHENLEQLVEAIAALEQAVGYSGGEPDQYENLARLYHSAGAWTKQAEALEQVGSRAATRAAADLYRAHGRLDDAARLYRLITQRKPSDGAAWHALDEVLQELGRWRELAEVRAERAARTSNAIDKASMLRAQARALEEVGEHEAASRVVARAAEHAPDHLSGLVDYVDMLARAGKGFEAAQVLAERIDDAIAAGAATDDIAALRMRLAAVLEEHCGDADGAARVIGAAIADAPGFAPALELLAARAAQRRDPRAHADALERYAAAIVEPADRAATLAEAARQWRAAGELATSVRGFERACEVAPDDAALATELDEARALVAVAKAASDVAAGDAAGAEKRLRAIVYAHPHQLSAALALADVLEADGRYDDASGYLRDALAAAPADLSNARIAPVVMRIAQIAAKAGELDEAHQLMHEAHRLDRTSLPIAIALGESCYARKLWRQTTLHLGGLADHPDAPLHAAAVARGLVLASQAEVRALRPQNARKHLDAALRLDPACGPALHALADEAIARGDLAAGADLLEREAAASSDRRERLRLFDALGDMARDVLADPARAERCWAQLGDDASDGVLAKLVALQRANGPSAGLGETLVRIAARAPGGGVRVGDPAKPLLAEAARTFAAAGELARADAIASDLRDHHPRDPIALAAACEVAAALAAPERAAPWLRPVLHADEARHADEEPWPDALQAELWRRLGDAERALGDELEALRAYQHAVAAEPDSPHASAARRALVELAATTGESARGALAELVVEHQAPDDVLAWARELARHGDGDRAASAFELAAALGAPLTDRDREVAAARPVRAMASDQAYPSVLTDADRRELVDDPADGAVGAVLALLAEAAPLVLPDGKTGLAAAGFADAPRVPATSMSAVVSLYPQIAKAFAGPAMLLHAGAAGDQLALLATAPPVVVVGSWLVEQYPLARIETASDDERAADSELRFWLGRIVELARPIRLFTCRGGARDFADWFTAIVRAFAPARADASASASGDARAVPAHVTDDAERVRARVPAALRARIEAELATAGELDALAYYAGCRRAADRVGLLACGDIRIAVAAAGGADHARHLIQLAVQPRYHALRRKLRPRQP